MDVLSATVLMVLGLAELMLSGTTGPVPVLGAAAMIAAVAVRRLAPSAAVVAAWSALLVQEGLGADITSQGYAAVIAWC